MLENSTKGHRFLVLLIASKDPSKNAYSALILLESPPSFVENKTQDFNKEYHVLF